MLRKISDYDNQTIEKCFSYEKKNDNSSGCILTDVESGMVIHLENGKYLSYFGTRFAKVDDSGVIHVFKNYMG